MNMSCLPYTRSASIVMKECYTCNEDIRIGEVGFRSPVIPLTSLLLGCTRGRYDVNEVPVRVQSSVHNSFAHYGRHKQGSGLITVDTPAEETT